MKRGTKLVLAGAVAALAVAGAAVAHERDGTRDGMMDRGPGQMRGLEMPSFAELDANGDGGITLDELLAHAAARIGEADSNGDGFLDVDELTEHMNAHFAERGAMQGKHRGDGPGAQAQTGPNAERMAEQRQEMLELRMKHMIENRDTDGDGKLSVAEMVPDRLAAMFERVDADGDGTVTEAEYNAIASRMGHMEMRHHDDDHDHHRGSWH